MGAFTVFIYLFFAKGGLKVYYFSHCSCRISIHIDPMFFHLLCLNHIIFTLQLMDVGLLLSLMVKETAENAQLVLCSNYEYTLVEHSTSPLLQRVEETKQQMTVRKTCIIIFLPVHVSFKLSLRVFTEFFHLFLKKGRVFNPTL